MDGWFFREGTEAEARDYLTRFLDEGAAAAEGFGPAADYSLASVPEVVSSLRGAPDWVRDLPRVAYYLGASFVTTYPVLRWELGAPDAPEVRQPVVTGFGSGDDLAVLGVAEALLAGGDPAPVVARWRDAVAG